jgi:hypothetical protein
MPKVSGSERGKSKGVQGVAGVQEEEPGARIQEPGGRATRRDGDRATLWKGAGGYSERMGLMRPIGLMCLIPISLFAVAVARFHVVIALPPFRPFAVSPS